MPRPPRLVDWPWVLIEVECSLCRRHGRYRLARLAEKLGAERDLGELLLIIGARCMLPKHDETLRRYGARCGARYRVPSGGPPPEGLPSREARPGEVWPPRPKRLGPEGLLPTVGDSRRQGITTVRLVCEGLLDGHFCHHTAEMSLDAMALSDETVFVHIPRLRGFRCGRCGGRKVRVLPSWPTIPGQMGKGAKPPPVIPGAAPEPRTPGTGPLPRGPRR